MTSGMHLGAASRSTAANRSSSLSSLRLSSRSPELFGLDIALSATFGGNSLARIFPSLNNANDIVHGPQGLGHASGQPDPWPDRAGRRGGSSPADFKLTHYRWKTGLSR